MTLLSLYIIVYDYNLIGLEESIKSFIITDVII